jgi:hypothetical protein
LPWLIKTYEVLKASSTAVIEFANLIGLYQRSSAADGTLNGAPQQAIIVVLPLGQ